MVPAISLNNFWRLQPSISSAVRHFKVSEIVIARRALDLGYISRKEFYDFYKAYANKEIKKERIKVMEETFMPRPKKDLVLLSLHM